MYLGMVPQLLLRDELVHQVRVIRITGSFGHQQPVSARLAGKILVKLYRS
jgi:hypothetical protein